MKELRKDRKMIATIKMRNTVGMKDDPLNMLQSDDH